MANNNRDLGIKAISTVLPNKKNQKIIEKYCWELSNEDVDVYNRYIYQVIGDFVNKLDFKIVLEQLKNKKIDWNHPCFEKINESIDEQNGFIKNPFCVEKGVTKCKCGSERVFTYTRQLRSADESLSVVAQCVECNAKWVSNG